MRCADPPRVLLRIPAEWSGLRCDAPFMPRWPQDVQCRRPPGRLRRAPPVPEVGDGPGGISSSPGLTGEFPRLTCESPGLMGEGRRAHAASWPSGTSRWTGSWTRVGNPPRRGHRTTTVRGCFCPGLSQGWLTLGGSRRTPPMPSPCWPSMPLRVPLASRALGGVGPPSGSEFRSGGCAGWRRSCSAARPAQVSSSWVRDTARRSSKNRRSRQPCDPRRAAGRRGRRRGSPAGSLSLTSRYRHDLQ